MNYNLLFNKTIFPDYKWHIVTISILKDRIFKIYVFFFDKKWDLYNTIL